MYNKRFCKEPKNIENYEKALADNFKGWHCHHRLETHNSDGERRLVDITRDELKALGMYYNRLASELIFLKISEHTSLHQKGKQFSEEHKKKISEANKGKHLSEEHKNKIGEGNRGKQLTEETRKKMSDAKKNMSEETKKKLSEANKGKTFSQEHRNKMSKARKGKHWFNNGKINKYCYECPDGFTPGRLRQIPRFIPVWFS